MKILIAEARAAVRGGAESYAAALSTALARMGHLVGHVDIDGHTPPGAHRTPLRGAIPGRILWNWAQVCRALPCIALDYDRVILAFGEGPALPVPTASIRHAPAIFTEDPALLSLLGARANPLRRAYVRGCRAIGRIPKQDKADLVLTNTCWTGQQMRRQLDIEPDATLYPPVRPPRHSTHCRRPFRLLVLGRITPNKRIEDALAITEALVARGLPVELEVCGRVNDRYGLRLADRISRNPHVQVSANATPSGKARALAEASVGLHLFRGEHFGIAVAEMLEAGCVPVVYDDGGVCELVTDPGLRFRTLGEATDTVFDLLTRPDRRGAAISSLANGKALAAAREFDTQVAGVLEGFLDGSRATDAA